MTIIMSSTHRRLKRPRMKLCPDSTSSNTRFGMNRREMMKLASVVMLPVMPEAAIASSENKTPRLSYKVFTATRPGLNRDVPARSEEHTSELQSQSNLVCRLLLEKKNPK